MNEGVTGGEGFAPCHKKVIIFDGRYAVWYDNSTCAHRDEAIGFVVEAGAFKSFVPDSDHPGFKAVLGDFLISVSNLSLKDGRVKIGLPEPAWEQAETYVRTGNLTNS